PEHEVAVLERGHPLVPVQRGILTGVLLALEEVHDPHLEIEIEMEREREDLGGTRGRGKDVQSHARLLRRDARAVGYAMSSPRVPGRRVVVAPRATLRACPTPSPPSA